MMRCFYLPTDGWSSGNEVSLPDQLQKHILKVLRLEPGTEFQLFNGRGLIADAVLQKNGSARIFHLTQQPEPLCHLTLIQGLPKRDKLELILQKGTELGVNHFVLVGMERSVGQVKSERREKRIERWQKITEEAARQSHQYYLPQVTIKESLAAALNDVQADRKIVLWEDSRNPLEGALPQSHPRRIAVVVGPEGGLSSQEVKLAGAKGYNVASLGPRILRTETAGLAIMSILQYLYGDLTSGQKQ